MAVISITVGHYFGFEKCANWIPHFRVCTSNNSAALGFAGLQLLRNSLLKHQVGQFTLQSRSDGIHSPAVSGGEAKWQPLSPLQRTALSIVTASVSKPGTHAARTQDFVVQSNCNKKPSRSIPGGLSNGSRVMRGLRLPLESPWGP
jgi:hypothetical protein